MSIPGSANPLLLASAAEAGAYQIERSVRFNSADSAYLSRTPASAGNRKTWTWAGWVKISAGKRFFSVGTSAANDFAVGFYGDRIDCINREGGNLNARIVSDTFYRDPSAWYHFLCVWDTTAVAPSDRFQAWINGERITSFILANYPSQNLDGICNTGLTHYIGSQTLTAGEYFSGYLADVHFIDGQALDPTSFGEFDANGVWQPKAYTGSYPGNSFHLPFSDNSTAAALGTDTSGNSNNWTVNNISVAAGAGNDSLVDTPTSYGTGNSGGDVRGNFATLNPLDIRGPSAAFSLSDGNLQLASLAPGSGATGGIASTIGVSSGKWYAEFTLAATSGAWTIIGVYSASSTIYPGYSSNSYGYIQSGNKIVGDSGSPYGSSYTANDVIGVALDMDAGTLTFYKNGTSQGQAFSGITGTIFFAAGKASSAETNTIHCNFGQRPFAYPAPGGFKALCTTNLPAPVVAKPSEVMDVALYTGNGSTQTISGLGFSPDLVWIKKRNSGLNSNHLLADTVRGVSTFLSSSGTFAESTFDATWRSAWGDLTAFNSDGFTVVAGSSSDDNINDSPNTHVAWTWDAGSSTVTNTQGSITSQVRANPSAGFSIVTYTGNSSFGATVGHGLGAAPSFIITKNRDQGPLYFWTTYHASLGATQYLQLNTTDAAVTNIGAWNNTAPTSSVFTLGNFDTLNRSGDRMVAYCFAPVAGYSSFGSYTGNGSADGPFVYTGFRPRWVLTKRTDSANDWFIYDAARDPSNVVFRRLVANVPDAEGGAGDVLAMDFTANGWKIRTTNAGWNANAGTYVWAAFAEHPFQYARAR